MGRIIIEACEAVIHEGQRCINLPCLVFTQRGGHLTSVSLSRVPKSCERISDVYRYPHPTPGRMRTFKLPDIQLVTFSPAFSKLSVNSIALPDFLLRSKQITLKGHRRSSCSSSVDVIKVNKYTRGALRWRWLSWGSCFAFQLCTFTYWETAFNLHCLFIAFQVPN